MIDFLKKKFFYFSNKASTPLERIGFLMVFFAGFYIFFSMLSWNIFSTSDKNGSDYSKRSFIYFRENLIRDPIWPKIDSEKEIKREIDGLIGYYCQGKTFLSPNACKWKFVSKNYPNKITNNQSLVAFDMYQRGDFDLPSDINLEILNKIKNEEVGLTEGTSYSYSSLLLYPQSTDRYSGDTYADNWHWLFGGWYIYDKQCIEKHYNGEPSLENPPGYLLNFDTQKYAFYNRSNQNWFEFNWEGIGTNSHCLKSKQWHKFHLETTIETSIFDYLESGIFDLFDIEITKKHIFVLFFIGLILFDGRFQKVCVKFWVWIRFGKK